MSKKVTSTVSSPDFVGRLRAAAVFVSDVKDKEYHDPGVDITGFSVPKGHKYESLPKERKVKRGTPYTLSGMARISNPILKLPARLLKAAKNKVGHTILDNAVNQDLAVMCDIFPEDLTNMIEYDPTKIINKVSQLSPGTMYNDSMNKLIYNLAMHEVSTITSLIGNPPEVGTRLDPKYLSNLDFLDEVRLFNMRLKSARYRGWNKTRDFFTDSWGRWYTILKLRGMPIHLYHGVNICVIVYNGEVMIGSKDAINHVYTLISSFLNWHIVEGLSTGGLRKVLKSFREDVFETRSYAKMLGICMALEPLSNALADLQGDCGYLFVQESVRGMAESVDVTLDDVVNILTHSTINNRYHDEGTLPWLHHLTNMSISDMMRFGQLYKPGMYALVDVEAGLKKLAKRVTRRFTTEVEATFDLIAFCTMSVCKKWTVGMSKPSLPELIATEPGASVKIKAMKIEFSALGKDKFWRKYDNVGLWRGIHPWAIVDSSKKPPLTDYIRDKRVHIDKVNFGQISKDDEVRYVICDHQDNEMPDLDELLSELKARHEKGARFEFEYGVDFQDFSERAKELIEQCVNFLTEGNPKEREQKDEARFYATTRFKLKKQLGYANELARQVAEFLPGNAMVVSDESRRQLIEKFGMSTSSDQTKKSMKIHVDISGHNQSFTTTPTKHWFKFIGDCIGKPDYMYLAFVFNNLFFHYKLPFIKAHYWHHGQNGGIEGWCGYAWGAHTGAAAEYFLYKNGYNGSAGAYGDDVAVNVELPESPNYNYLETSIANHFASFNQEVKISQTSITRTRATLTRKTYVLGSATSSDLKKLMTCYQVVDAQVQSDLASSSGIGSSITSALSDSDDFWMCIYLKWALITPIACGTWYACIRGNPNIDLPSDVTSAVNKFLSIRGNELDVRSLLSKTGRIIVGDLMITVTSRGTKANPVIEVCSTSGLPVYSGDLSASGFKEIIQDDSNGRRIVANTVDYRDMFAYCVAPQTLGGLGMLIWVNSVVTGISDTRAEVLELINRTCEGHICNLIMGAISDSDLTYNDIIANRYAVRPIAQSHSDVLNSALAMKLETVIRNPAIKEYMRLSQDRELIINVIVACSSKKFSQRISQKLLDCADISIIDQIISKISSAGAIMRLLDHSEHLLGKLNNLGPTNLKILTNQKSVKIPGSVKIVLDAIKHAQYYGKIEFVDPHEPGVQDFASNIGSAVHMNIKKISPFLLDGSQRPAFRHQEVKPKYGKIGLMDIAINDIVFRKVIDLARFVVWIEADQGMMNNNITQIADFLLRRMTTWTIADLRPMIPIPYGGELFHRIDNHGFKSGVMLRTMPRYTGCVNTSFMPTFVVKTGGVNSNVNYGYLDAVFRLAYLLSTKSLNMPGKMKVMGFSESAFGLTMDVSDMDLVYMIKFPKSIMATELESKVGLEVDYTIRSYLSWLATNPSYEEIHSVSKLGVVKMVTEGNITSLASHVVEFIANNIDIPPHKAKRELLMEVMEVLNIPSDSRDEVCGMIMYDTGFMSSSKSLRHQDVREELCNKLRYDQWPAHKIPNVFSEKGKDILMSMIVLYSLVLVNCPDHPSETCLSVDWERTSDKARILRKYVSHLKIKDEEQENMFWVSNEGLVTLVKIIRESNLIPCCIGRRGPSKANLGSSLSNIEVYPLEFVRDMTMAPVISAIENDAMMTKVMKGTKLLKKVHEVLGEYKDETNYHYYVLRCIQESYLQNINLFDCTSGIGRVRVAAEELGLDVVSATVDDIWLRRGIVANGIHVNDKYNYCDTKSWPQDAEACNVHYIDAHVLYKGDATQGDFTLPDHVDMIVLKTSDQILSALSDLIPDIKLLFPYRYMISITPTSRRNFIMLSKVNFWSVRAPNQVIRSQMRFMRAHPVIGPYNSDDMMTFAERQAVVLDVINDKPYMKREKGEIMNVNYDPWEAAPYMKFVDKWVSGKADGESLEDYAERSTTKSKTLSSESAHAMKVLLESGIDLKNITEGDYMLVKDQNVKAILWILRSMSCNAIVDPTEYYLLRLMPAMRRKLVTWHMMSLIRKWVEPVISIYNDLGLGFKKQDYVLKRYKKYTDTNDISRDMRDSLFLSPKMITPKVNVEVNSEEREYMKKVASLMLDAVVWGTSDKKEKSTMKQLVGSDTDLLPDKEQEEDNEAEEGLNDAIEVEDFPDMTETAAPKDHMLNLESFLEEDENDMYFDLSELVGVEGGIEEDDFFLY